MIVPLYLFNNSNHLPLVKIANSKSVCKLIVKLASKDYVTKDYQKNIVPINMFLWANYITFSDKLPNSIKMKSFYVYPGVKLITRKLINKKTKSDNFIELEIQLDHFEHVKNIIITILTDESINDKQYNEYFNGLIDMELYYLGSKGSKILHSKLDSLMLNHLIPLELLNRKLPKGIYFYSFSINPISDEIIRRI